MKHIVPTIYAPLFGTILLCSDCVIPGRNRVPGTSYVPTSMEHVHVLYQPLTRPYKVIGFVSVDRAIAGRDSVIEGKFRAVAATMGADAGKIGGFKKLFGYLIRYLAEKFPRISDDILRAMKPAEKRAEGRPITKSLYGWLTLATHPKIVGLFILAIVLDALVVGALVAVHLLISLVRKPRARVFISYHHERESIGDMLADEMTKCGIRAEKLPFMEGPDSDTLLDQVDQHIDDCHVFICVPGNRPSFVDHEVAMAFKAKKPMLFVLIETDAPHLPDTAKKGYPVFALERLQREGVRILASFCSYLAADWRSTARLYGAVLNHLPASTVLVFAVYFASTVILTFVMGSSKGPDVAVPPVEFFPPDVSNPVFLASFVSPLILFLIPYGLFFITRWAKRAQLRSVTRGQKFRDSFIPKTLGYSLTRAHLRKILYRGDIVAHHESGRPAAESP